MYSRFLKEAAEITSNTRLNESASMIDDSGKLFTEIALIFKHAATIGDIASKIDEASDKFTIIADMEEKTYHFLTEHIPDI